MELNHPVLSWLHFGDLHMTQVGEQNHRDFAALVEAANQHVAGAVDFAVLPGDNADDGTAQQFQLVADVAHRLDIPLHILPGDHDFKERTLDGFHGILGAQALPRAETVSGHRCLFLDVVSHGTGGPDFRLDAADLAWLERELTQANAAGENTVVFMHTYPADLRQGASELAGLLTRHRVVFVDMGHTHYNEVSNDGCTIFAATRSTGQIEEGDVGFSIASIDRGVVSWTFKPASTPWPLIQITTPADHRLITDLESPQQLLRDSFDIRAKLYGNTPIDAMTFEFAAGIKGELAAVEGHKALWHAAVDNAGDLTDGTYDLIVRARHQGTELAAETIRVALRRHRGGPGAPCNVGTTPGDACRLPDRAGRSPDHAGSDRYSIGAWPEKHLLGTQLGPNRNGKPW